MKIERCSPVAGRYCAWFRGAVEARQPPRPVPSRTFGGAGRRRRLRRWSARGGRRGSLGFYEWSGSTIEYHRAQVRDHLGYRVATVADRERLTVWLSEAVAHAERRPEGVRDPQFCSAVRRAERTIRTNRPGVGGSIRNLRNSASSSSRTPSGRRSACATASDSQTVNLSRSATVATR